MPLKPSKGIQEVKEVLGARFGRAFDGVLGVYVIMTRVVKELEYPERITPTVVYKICQVMMGIVIIKAWHVLRKIAKELVSEVEAIAMTYNKTISFQMHGKVVAWV